MSSYNALAEYYDELTGSNISYKQRADYFDKLIKRYVPNGGILLDLGCGTGVMCEEMSAKGYDVIGADLSPEMLSIAQMNKSGDILYICQDIRAIELFNSADAVISTLDTINHLLSEKDVFKCFKSVHDNMKTGGVFVFDMNTMYKHERIMGNNSFVYDLDDVYCVWSSSFNKKTYINEIIIDIFSRDGDAYYRSGEEFCERAYSVETITSLLSDAGFTVENVYEGDTENEHKQDSERIVFIARK